MVDKRIIFVSFMFLALPAVVRTFPVSLSFLGISLLLLVDVYNARNKRELEVKEMITLFLRNPFWPTTEPLRAKFSKKTDKQFAYGVGIFGLCILSIPFSYQEADAARPISLFLYLIGVLVIAIAAHYLMNKHRHKI